MKYFVAFLILASFALIGIYICMILYRDPHYWQGYLWIVFHGALIVLNIKNLENYERFLR